MAVVLITGCSSGIGFEAALSFARAGDIVCATMRDMSKSDRLLSEAKKEGLAIDIRHLDVTNAECFPDFLQSLTEQYGEVDVLVNNAGILPIGAFEDIPESEFRHVMETNFFGPALLARALLPHMRIRKQGYIIMVSSLSSFAAKAGDSIYSASKFALEGLTEGFRHEVARWNIKTALVQPGQYATGIFSTAVDGNLGSCHVNSPYYSLIQSQQRDLVSNISKGNDPRHLADLLVHISRSDGSRFRWQADTLAERVSSKIFALSDADRDRFLRDVADVDWWISGAEAPETKGEV